MPLVSVIIPVHNGEKYIREAVDSVLAQTFTDFEIIVVNDNSSDRTEEYLREYGNRVVVLTNTGKGPGPSRNMGVKAARGSLIAFLDADDAWFPTKLEKQVAIATSNLRYGIITCDAEVFNDAGIVASSSKEDQPISNGDVMEVLLFHNWIGTSCVLVRKECIEEAGYFHETPFIRGEDWVLWMQIASRHHVYFVDEVLVRYRLHSQSYSRANLEKQFSDLFHNLEIVERTIPRLTAKPELLREARFRICWRRGWDDLTGLSLDLAREKFRQCRIYKPYNPKVWAALAAAYTPSFVLRSLKNAARATRNLRTSATATR
jgi:glycosyltransferase involved in cell wall biosynthesis